MMCSIFRGAFADVFIHSDWYTRILPIGNTSGTLKIQQIPCLSFKNVNANSCQLFLVLSSCNLCFGRPLAQEATWSLTVRILGPRMWRASEFIVAPSLAHRRTGYSLRANTVTSRSSARMSNSTFNGQSFVLTLLPSRKRLTPASRSAYAKDLVSTSSDSPDEKSQMVQ